MPLVNIENESAHVEDCSSRSVPGVGTEGPSIIKHNFSSDPKREKGKDGSRTRSRHKNLWTLALHREGKKCYMNQETPITSG